MEEGELFGVRAIQRGFYGGVAQSAPSSPVGSRAPSLYNSPTTPSGPLSGRSPYLPLMHPQPTASPMASTTSLVLPRSPLGLNPVKMDERPGTSNGPLSPLPSALLRDTRPGTAGSNRSFTDPARPPFLHERQDSNHSQKTINLDGLAPVRQPPVGTSLRPSTSDASNADHSSNQGTSHGSRGSSFTSTYSFDEGSEQQPQNPKIVKPFEGLPTIPALTPLSAEVHSGNSRQASPQPPNPSSPPRKHNMTAELPTDLQRSPPRETNFSTPFRRPSQPDVRMPPPSPGFGPLPAAAMNGGPQQFRAPPVQNGQLPPRRTDSPGPMNRGPPSRTASPAPNNASGPFPNIGQSQRSMSPAGQRMPQRGPDPNRPRNDSVGQKRGPPAPLTFAQQEPSLPVFLNGSKELQIPQFPYADVPQSAPPTKTTSSHLMPAKPKANRMTADILNDFYDSYYRDSRDDMDLGHAQRQHQQPQQGRENALNRPQR
jgi:hypothetical protein